MFEERRVIEELEGGVETGGGQQVGSGQGQAPVAPVPVRDRTRV